MFGSLNPCQFKRITGNTLVKTGSGNLTGLLVATGTPTITVYDGLTNAGTKIVNGIVCAAATPYPMPVKFNVGCYIESSGGDTTVFYD